MFKIFGFFILICATCLAVPASLPSSPQVSCESIPELRIDLPMAIAQNLWSCINMPYIGKASPDFRTNCKIRGFTTCDKMTCTFRERGWMNGAAVNKSALSAELETFSSSDSALHWTEAIQKAKTTCLGQNLLVNVYNINCSVYDVAYCITAALIKHAPPTTWTEAPHCAPSRRYAESCPECPECVARSLHVLPQ